MVASFTLTGTGFDTYVVIKLAYPQDLDVSSIESIVVSYNDSNATNGGTYSFASNLNDEWSTYELSSTEIASKRARINGLDNSKKYIFSALIIYTNSDDELQRSWTNQTPEISLQRKPLGVKLLQDIDGKVAEDTEAYDVTVEYPIGFYDADRVPDKIIFLLYDNDLTPNDTVTQQEFPIPLQNDTDTLNRRFTIRITGLITDKTYECACITVRGAQSTLSTAVSNMPNKYGTLTTSILISASQRPTPPSKPNVVFDYVNGGVTLDTSILSIGGGDGLYFYYILQILDEDNTVLDSIQSNNLITESSTDADLKSFSLNTRDYSNKFSIGSTYRVRFLSQNSSNAETGRSLIPTDQAAANQYVATFQILKYPEAPTVDIDEVLVDQNSITFTWNKPELYNASLHHYVLNLRTSPTGPIVNTYDVYDSNGTVYYTNEDSLSVGTKYYASVYAVIENYLNNDYWDEDNLLNGAESSKSNVWATPYNSPQAPTLNLSYAEADVNSKVVFSIENVPTFLTQSGLEFSKFEIGRQFVGFNVDLTHAHLINLTNLSITSLNNGTEYLFSVRSVVTTGTSVSNPNLQNQLVYGSPSNEYRFYPWSRPAAPSITVVDVGNRFIQAYLQDNNTSNVTGVTTLEYFDLGTVGGNVNIQSYSYEHYYYNLENDTQYTLPISAVYENPNYPEDSAYYIVVTGSSTTGTPVFDAKPYQPLVVSAGNSIVDTADIIVTWAEPNLNGDSDDNMVLQSYTVYTYLNGVQQNSPVYTTESNYTFEQVVTGLTLGTEYQFKVVANYTDSVGSRSVDSALSNVATPYTTAAAPSINSVTIGDSQLTVGITNPSFTGGLEIQGYKIYYSLNSNGSFNSYQQFMNTNLQQILEELTNGFGYYIAASVITYIPYSTIKLEGAISDYTSTAYTPRPATIADITNFYMSRNGYDIADDQTVGKIELSWDPVINSDLDRIGYEYEIQRVTGMLGNIADNLVSDTVTHVDSETTSTEFSNLTLGTTYYYVIRLSVNDPNNAGSYIYGPYSGPISVVPYDNTPAKVMGVNATGSDQQIDVTWTSESTIGGAAVAGYNVYIRETNQYVSFSKVNYSLIDSNDSSFNINGLTNGTTYDIIVTYVNEYGDESSTEDGKYVLDTATPFTAPSAAVISIDDQVASTGQNVIRMNQQSSSNGSAVIGYKIFENGVDLGEVEFPYTRSQLTNGTSYTYYVIPLYYNLNLNTDATLEGPQSNSVTKIPFRADIAPSISYVLNLGDAETVRVTFSFIADATTGLASSTQQLYLVANNQEILLENLIAKQGIEYEHELTLAKNTKYTFKMYSSFENPNSSDYDRVESSFGNSVDFIAYGTPSIASFSVQLEGAQTIVSLIQDIDLNGGAFDKYILNVYNNSTNALVQGPVESYQETNTFTGLTNGVEYKVTAQVVVLPQYHGKGTVIGDVNEPVTSNAINAYGTPIDTKVPQIISVTPSNTPDEDGNVRVLDVLIQTYFQDILRLILFVSPINNLFYLEPLEELYYQVGLISASDAQEDGKITVPIRLNTNITAGDLRSLACIAINNDGASNTYFSPQSSQNYLAGGSKNYDQVPAPYVPSSSPPGPNK